MSSRRRRQRREPPLDPDPQPHAHRTKATPRGTTITLQAALSGLAAAALYTLFILFARAAVACCHAPPAHRSAPPPPPPLLYYGGGFAITYAAVALVWWWWRSATAGGSSASTAADATSQCATPWFGAFLVLSGIAGSFGTFHLLRTMVLSRCATWTTLITLCVPLLAVSVIGAALFGERIPPAGWALLVACAASIGGFTYVVDRAASE
jgi:hypothetical protein